MIIAPATIVDAAEILALQKLAYVSEAEIYGDFSIPPLLQTLPQIQADFASHVFLNACQDGVILGSVRGLMQGDTCLVGRLIVRPDARRQGLGTGLMLAIEQSFTQARRHELFTGHKSEGNLRLYERLGYRVFDSKPVNDKLTLVFLEKTRAKSSGTVG